MHTVNKYLTLPNLISFARICFILPFVICLIQVQHHNFYRYIALGVLLAIGLSDVLDGYLARKRGEVTTFGKYLDPAADKLLLLIACFLLSSDKLWPGPIFPVWVLTVIVSREVLFLLGMLAVFVTIKRKIIWQPNKLGKLTTFLQITAIIAVLLGNLISLNTLAILWCVVVVVTLLSAVNYTYLGVRQL
ncbi:CDP-diacylglycerol--glycerol-3-phosphate 3-phosphatidyltransferase [Candidatus Brocadiaceae bacterium S225]|nr:CDP-diacylglycerol--glycerol-3-phosphate 3-phosphatidyltransferase [Candidatus Brocadiaceae bacterium S225]